MGKTMLSLYLTQELERMRQDPGSAVILYYFCDGRDHKRNNAVDLLRGLIYLLVRTRPGLMKFLVSEYEIQKQSLFSQTSIEALWRVFESMVRDESAGQVYCIIDGLDECKQDSLWHFLRKIRSFYEDEPQIVVDDEEPEGITPAQSQTLNSAGQKLGAGLKMVLISREAPECLFEELSEFPRVQLGAGARGKAKPRVRPPNATKLSDVVTAVIRQRTPKKEGSHVHQKDSDLQLQQAKPEIHQTPAPQPPQTQSSNSVGRQQPSLEQVNFQVPLVEGDPELTQYTAEPAEYAAEEADYVFDEVDEEHLSEENSQNGALQLYIEAKVEEISTERSYSETLSASITHAFQGRGDGTFLWVDLAIEELRRVDSSDVQETLNHLPGGLADMYSRNLYQIPPNLIDLAAAILRWVVAARRPLYTYELSIGLNLANLNPVDPIGLLKQGIEACGNILAINQDETVNIIHASAKDFLVGNSPQLLGDPCLARFQVRTEDVDGEISQFCLSYLEQDCLKDGPLSYGENQADYMARIDHFPFLPYATLYWHDHVRSAARPYLNLSSPFFVPESAIRKSWWITYWTAMTGRIKVLAPRGFTLLHLAAYLDLKPLAEQLLQSGKLQSRLEKKDSHGNTALTYAIERGHMSMFLFLLQLGAKKETLGESILDLACRKGQRDIAEYLLNHGHDANAVAQEIEPMQGLGLALRWLPAILNETVNLQEDEWKLMTKDTGKGGTPLHCAASYGHTAVVELLLSRGANVGAITTKAWTPLHAAAWTGQVECIKIFYNKGVDLFGKADFGYTPLHCAASRGKLPAVQLFLNLGMPVDTLTAKQKSALHLSAYAGYTSLVCFLVEQGADLEAKSHKGETPLHLAARGMKPGMVELLLSLGSDRLATRNNGQLPIDLVRAGLSKEQKQSTRILQTFGTPGYQPWQPTVDLSTAATASDAAGQTTVDQGAPGFNVSVAASAGMSSPSGHHPTPAFQANVSIGVQPQHRSQTFHSGIHHPTNSKFSNTQDAKASEEGFPQNPAKEATTSQRTQSTPTLPYGKQYTPASYPPPPPYTSSPATVQGRTPFEGALEKACHASLSELSPQTASNPWQSPAAPVFSAPGTERRHPFIPPNMPDGQENPQSPAVSPPQFSTAQHGCPPAPEPPQSPLSQQSALLYAEAAHPPSRPLASPVAPQASPVSPFVQERPTAQQQHPAIRANYTYGPSAVGHIPSQQIYNSPPHSPYPASEQQYSAPQRHQSAQYMSSYPQQQVNPAQLHEELGQPEYPQQQPFSQQYQPPKPQPTFTPKGGMPTLPHSVPFPIPPFPILQPSTPSVYSPQYEYSAPPLTQPYSRNPQQTNNQNINPNQQPQFQPPQFPLSQPQYQQQQMYPDPSAHLSLNFTPSRGNGVSVGSQPGITGIYFPPPPTTLQKKKSWIDLGRILK
jgi:ankyrin repeat protein